MHLSFIVLSSLIHLSPRLFVMLLRGHVLGRWRCPSLLEHHPKLLYAFIMLLYPAEHPPPLEDCLPHLLLSYLPPLDP